MVIKVLRELIQLFPVFHQDLGSLVVLLLYHLNHQFVDLGLGLSAAGQRSIATQILFVTVSMATMSNSLLMP